jgi:hypothetical protein
MKKGHHGGLTSGIGLKAFVYRHLSFHTKIL